MIPGDTESSGPSSLLRHDNFRIVVEDFFLFLIVVFRLQNRSTFAHWIILNIFFSYRRSVQKKSFITESLECQPLKILADSNRTDRFLPSNSSTRTRNTLIDITNRFIEKSPSTVGKAQLQPGWSISGQPYIVSAPAGAPGLPPDLTLFHKQVKIKSSEDGIGKRYRPKSCKICKVYSLKQKKAPYLCIECGDFFCHDTERGRTGSVPRGCYWTHACHIFRDSGAASYKWISDFENWNTGRVLRCKRSDGL